MDTPNAVRELLADAARRADCTRRHVGAVLTSSRGAVLAVGWNGLPDGSCELGECPRGRLSYDELPASSDYNGNCEAVHAERMTLARAAALGLDPRGGTCWVTDEPCPWCAAALREAGVRAVVVGLAGKVGPTP